MKEVRYLIRLVPLDVYSPSDQASLLTRVRELASPYKGKAINLRVSPVAIEFDLFCSPAADLQEFETAFMPLGKPVTCKRLDIPTVPIIPQSLVDEARRLFNEHRFWEVHEVLEGLWKELHGPEKQLVQGLILVAAALVHAQKDEIPVMWTMLADALKRLEGQPADYYGWNIQEFRKQLNHMLDSRSIITLAV